MEYNIVRYIEVYVKDKDLFTLNKSEYESDTP